VTANSGLLSLRLGLWLDNLYGSFQYNGAGDLSGGVVTRWVETYAGNLVYDIRDVSVSVPTFLNWVATDNNLVALQTILDGADSIAGSASADLLRGFRGADTIMGGGGDDAIDGGSGVNYLRGDDGNDQLLGGADFDDINGNMGADTAAGGDGDDWVVGGKDADTLSGDAGNDIVYGNIGNDTIAGGAGDDIVRGGQDNDVATGGAGADWMSGDRGDDTVSGGSGADIFHTFGEAGLDRVTDFSRAEGDRVMLDPGTTYSVAQTGADTVISMGAGGQMILAGVQISSLTGDWIFGA